MSKQDRTLNDDIVDFVRRWNNLYPIDHWWRKKHKIPFNSLQHRNQCILDMRIEYEEDFLYGKYLDDLVDKRRTEKEDQYTPGYGSVFRKKKIIEVDAKEAEILYDNLDISKIEESEDGKIII